MKNQFIVALLGSVLFLFSYIAQAEVYVFFPELKSGRF